MVNDDWRDRLRHALVVALIVLASMIVFYAVGIAVQAAHADTWAYVLWTRGQSDTDTPFDYRDTDARSNGDPLYAFIQTNEAVVRVTGDDTGVSRVSGDIRVTAFSDSQSCQDYLFDTLNTKFWPRHWK